MSQCEPVSPLRSGEFQVSQAEISQCGGGRQSNRPHVFFLGVVGAAGVLWRAVITNLAAGRASRVIIGVTEKPRLHIASSGFRKLTRDRECESET